MTKEKKAQEHTDILEILDEVVQTIGRFEERLVAVEKNLNQTIRTQVDEHVHNKIEETIKETIDTQLNVLPKLQDRVEQLSVALLSLEEHVNNIQARPKQTEQPAESFTNEIVVDNQNDLVDIAREILGNGDRQACQFDVSFDRGDAGRFRLTIIPPVHLRENENDQRVKMIPYPEAETGTREYATQVRDFCIRWATKNGVPFIRV